MSHLWDGTTNFMAHLIQITRGTPPKQMVGVGAVNLGLWYSPAQLRDEIEKRKFSSLIKMISAISMKKKILD